MDQDSLDCRMWIKMNQLYKVTICLETDSTFIGNCHYKMGFKHPWASMGITFWGNLFWEDQFVVFILSVGEGGSYVVIILFPVSLCGEVL